MTMEDLLTCCMGLDIHKDTIVACLLVGDTETKPEKKFGRSQLSFLICSNYEHG